MLRTRYPDIDFRQSYEEMIEHTKQLIVLFNAILDLGNRPTKPTDYSRASKEI